jgi:hypothetical protein
MESADGTLSGQAGTGPKLESTGQGVTAEETDSTRDDEEGQLSPARTVTGLVVGFSLLGLCVALEPVPGVDVRAQAVLGVFLWFLSVSLSGALNQITIGLATPLLLVLAAGYRVPEGFKAFSSPVFLWL